MLSTHTLWEISAAVSKSTLKAALGVGSFMPPPVGVACMAISGIWAVSELVPGVSDAIDKGFFFGF
jgi:hypothetical protein